MKVKIWTTIYLPLNKKYIEDTIIIIILPEVCINELILKMFPIPIRHQMLWNKCMYSLFLSHWLIGSYRIRKCCGYPPQHDGNILFLKTSHAFSIEDGEIWPGLHRKLTFSLLASIVLEGTIHAAKGEK